MRWRSYHLLALLPGLAMLIGVPLVNRVRPFVLGLPFLLFWIVGCVLLTSLIMALIAHGDRAAGQEPPAPEVPDAPDDRPAPKDHAL